MEWAVLVAFAALAAALIGLRAFDGHEPDDDALEVEGLREERARLLGELRELDEDAAAGRISADDRRAGRRAIAPRLREATEMLRAAGAEPETDAHTAEPEATAGRAR